MVMLGLFSADTLTISYSDHDLELGQTPFMLFKEALKANWILFTLGSTFLVLGSMLLSHRIAGPIYRFEKTLDLMLSGKLTDVIHLREKDEGKELAEKINQFNFQLKDSYTSIYDSSEEITSLIQTLQELELSAEVKEQLGPLCKSLNNHNESIKKNCNSFDFR